MIILILISFFMFSHPYLYGDNVVDHIEKAIESVAKIKASGKQGTGFFITHDILVTNAHIITNQNGLIPVKSIQIEKIGHYENISAKVIGIRALSFVHDFSLLQVKGYQGGVLSVGEWFSDKEVYLMGFHNDGDLQIMKTEYTQNRENAYYTIGNFVKFLFGVSGGPLLNFKGQIVGVITSGTVQFIIAQKIIHLQNIMRISESLKEPQEIFQEAMNRINQLADNQNDRHAQFALGLMYREGHGVKKDSHKAIKWFTQSAQQEHVLAQFKLGVFYLNEITPPDYIQARRWLGLAAEKNLPDAQNKLSSLYLTGQGLGQPDYKKAYELFKQAAENGDPYAQYNVGLMYYYGMGIRQNINKARKWCERAAQQNISDALEFLETLQ